MEKEKINNENKDVRDWNLETEEDVTKYGEFVCSYFAWISLEDQKENTKKFENITKKKKQIDDKKTIQN